MLLEIRSIPPLMGALDRSGERFKKSEVSVSVLTGFT